MYPLLEFSRVLFRSPSLPPSLSLYQLQKSIMGKGNRFDNPAPEQAYRPPSDPTHQTASLIAKEEIKLEKKIGEGAHGSVYEGTWSNAHGSVREGGREG